MPNPSQRASGGIFFLQRSWLRRNLLIAFAYALSGQLGLLLSAPPMYASALWPPAGIALAGALLYGAHVLPGILLGAFFVNLETLGFSTGNGPFQIDWTPPLLISAGAALQACLGARLARWGGGGISVREPLPLLKTLLLGGVLATLGNASWSAVVLYVSNTVADHRWWQNLLNWWIGDSLGALLFTPLLLAWYGRTRPDLRHARLLTLALLASFILTTAGLILTAQLEAQERIARFQARARAISSHMEHRALDYETFGDLLTGFFYGSTDVDKNEFRVFVGSWMQKHPEVSAIEWAPLIRDSERTAFEQQLQALYGHGQLKSHWHPEPGGLPHKPDYVPLLYVEAVAQFIPQMGLDLSADPSRRYTLELAAQQGQPTLTPPLSLVQDPAHHAAALLATPIYLQPHSMHNWQQVRGFVVLVLQIDKVMDYLLHDAVTTGQTVLLRDQDSDRIIYGRPPDPHLQRMALRMHLHEKTSARIGGRNWQLEIWPASVNQPLAKSWLSWLILGGSLPFVALAVGVALLGVERQRYLEHEIAQRTQELRQRNTELDDERQQVLAINVALEAARNTAVAANLAKSNFLASVSHELRTPMNAILGLTYLLQNSKPNAETSRDYLHHIDQSARVLLTLINDILDLSKIEAGRMELYDAPFSLADLIRTTLRQIQQEATDKELELRVQIAEDLPAMLWGDALRLGQVLLNLCGNAVKFTEQGVIEVRARVLNGTEPRLLVEVTDSGIGIDLSRYTDIFSSFSQADGSISRRYGGTGLGLAICRKLVELMGGEIGVSSVPGQGSTFIVNLPLRLPPPEAAAQAAALASQ